MKKLISLILVLVMAFTIVMPASAFELRLTGGDVPVVTIYGDGEPLYNADGTVYGEAVDSVESYIARTAESELNESIMKFAASAKNYFS